MAVVPSMIHKNAKEAPQILLNISTLFTQSSRPACLSLSTATTFPSHPIAYAAIRFFANHGPEVYDASFWKHQVIRIGGKHRNDPAARLRATTHWLACLTIMFRYVIHDEACGLRC